MKLSEGRNEGEGADWAISRLPTQHLDHSMRPTPQEVYQVQ
jgi:hypothetical protein